jgi:hypothetical protein
VTRKQVVAVWLRIVSDAGTRRRCSDPEWIAGWAREVTAMRENPCVRWPSPMPGWGWV